MDRWVPLFDIFLKSPTPEADASRWLQESFNAAATPPTTTSSFLSLLTEPRTAVVADSSSGKPINLGTKRVMFVQTLPSTIQSRILSFLAFDHQRFSAGDLSKLARGILTGDEGTDFWVERVALHLFDIVSVSNHSRAVNLSYSEEGRIVRNEFESVPVWLKNMAGGNAMVFPWLPVPIEELNQRWLACSCGGNDEDDFIYQLSQAGEDLVNKVDKDVHGIEAADGALDVPLDPEIRAIAEDLRSQVLNFGSTSRTVALANEICGVCLGRRAHCLAILELIEPWRADDETTSILISSITNMIEEDDLTWASQVLCSFVLPKSLFLDKPASRVLLTSVIEFCKLYQRAAEYGLILPLVLRKDGINNHMCELISRVIRECFHPAQVTAFCQKLLCNGKEPKRFVCLPCHRCFISEELIWTESVFVLLQNILNHNVNLTQDCIDEIVSQIQEKSARFSRSLKFGNFLLCLVTKCASSLVSHKLALIKAVECTDILVTKPLLSKLSSL